MVTQDAVFIDRAGPTIRGRAGIDSLVRGLLATMSLVDAKVDKDDLSVSGDLAYYIGRYDESWRPRQGALVHDRGRFLFVWQRQADGTWKIARSIGTDPARGSTPSSPAAADSAKAKSG